MRTRFPFRYGIAALTELPHLFVKAEVEIDGKIATGTSADGLPPKWFTKNPETTFEEDDLPNMCRVIRHAAETGVDIGRCGCFFDWWKQVYDAQSAWATGARLPPLLAGFGFSLIERAVLDAFCRHQKTTLHQALYTNSLRLDFHALREFTDSIQPANVLPTQPARTLTARHTIGLGDPLTDADVGADDRPHDMLPYTLEENIRNYGLTFFKIKLCGDFDWDCDRLKQLSEIFDTTVGPTARFTLDGNESYRTVTEFREHWEQLREHASIRRLIDQSLMFVEQPVHRDTAFDPGVADQLANWPNAPTVIIDESDGDLNSFPTAIELGYSGTSHKNCKGVIKGLLNAASVAEAQASGQKLILSGEDLANVGPVALLQDLAVVASLGITHVERNGHHYFAGLSQFPSAEQQRTLAHHSDLYSGMPHGFPALQIVDGKINVGSVVDAPFGMAEQPDMALFDEWDF